MVELLKFVLALVAGLLWWIQTMAGEICMPIMEWAKERKYYPIMWLVFIFMIPFILINNIVTPFLESRH